MSRARCGPRTSGAPRWCGARRGRAPAPPAARRARSPPDIVTRDVATRPPRLPHPVHIHCNNLGLPGNWRTTLATMEALEGRRAHLTHIQFHSYGGGDEDQGTFCSHVHELADYVNSHKNLTVDVGQVLFGET